MAKVEMTQAEREQALNECAQYVYQKNNRAFQPLYPWVLVRLLPKTQNYKGLLVLPEKQNKTMHEAIVLVTWKPKLVFDKLGRGRLHTSELSPGTHVIFPHWAGLPVLDLDDTYYRIVREEGDTTDGCIQAVVENGVDTGAVLRQVLNASFEEMTNIAKTIEKRFILIDREAPSVTMSGV